MLYRALDSAAKVAEMRIKHEASRERSVQLVREALAHAIERGEPIRQPRQRGETVAQGAGNADNHME